MCHCGDHCWSSTFLSSGWQKSQPPSESYLPAKGINIAEIVVYFAILGKMRLKRSKLAACPDERFAW
jgi:hypothetical protein